jgi:pyrroloquinoline quinone (PQQ) biosynthesis protein C
VNLGYYKAQSASAGYESNREAAEDDRPDPREGETTIYNQYNTSPKALSPAEIYRQTKNQLSVRKGAVTT